MIIFIVGCAVSKTDHPIEDETEIQPAQPSPSTDNATISIAAFNIQVFGKTKAGKPEVMEILARTISEFDI